MIFLPHSTDLKLSRRPYVTYAVIVICLFIHYLQEQSRDEVWHAARNYCELINYSNEGRSIHGLVDIVPLIEQREIDYLRKSESRCRRSLSGWHEQPNKGNIERFILRRYEGSDEAMTKRVAQAVAHYNSFVIHAPVSLDEKLMYDPATPNPIRMLTSSLAHADWGHVIFNLIFFFAFAPALELMCLHPLRFIGVLAAICVSTSVVYSLFSIGSLPIPTLGLSGVVMGMIGLSAYMMPWARIRTLVWFLFFVRNIHIPAWILAGFYIGGDLLTLFNSGNSGGVNVLAHVVGGISGYLIGRFWLKQQKQEVQEDLEEEMEERASVRNDVMRVGSTSRAGQHRMVNQRRDYEARRKYQAYLDRLHKLIETEQDSDAVLWLLNEYDDYSKNSDIYDELFTEALKWQPGRATLCLGRLNITLLLRAGKTTRTLEVLKQCQALSAEFVLASHRQNGPLLKVAMAKREYQLAYLLLHKAAERYGESVDAMRYRFMEVQLLIKHLQRYDEAKQLLKRMVADEQNPYRSQAQQMAKHLEQIA